MNKETLQEYNTRLTENNTSLDDILTTINNLPETGSGGGSSDIYSTDEIVVGTWIDGKPLYRKVSELEPTFIKGTNYFSTGINNADAITKSILHFKYSSKWYFDWDGLLNRLYLDNGARYMVNTDSALTPQVMYLITEYTKTTD